MNKYLQNFQNEELTKKSVTPFWGSPTTQNLKYWISLSIMNEYLQHFQELINQLCHIEKKKNSNRLSQRFPN